jgi:hypothetical protein
MNATLPRRLFALVTIAFCTVAMGCSDRGFMRGLLAGHLMGDHEDFEQRAQFNGYLDRVKAYEGSQAAGGP